jgi:hypothetical protein
MKKLLIMSIALVAIMATVLTVSAFAANTVEITGISLAKYGSADTFNDAYANVTVNYTVTEDTAGAVDRLTFYLAAQDLSAALEGEEAKVIYIDEQVEADAGSLTFVIEKARVKSAVTAKEGSNKTYGDIENFALVFKLGGTEVDTADSKTVVYNNPTVYGDVSGDGKIKAKDAGMIASAAVKAMDFTAEQTVAGDVDGNGAIKAKDAGLAASIAVKALEYNDLLGSMRKFNY